MATVVNIPQDMNEVAQSPAKTKTQIKTFGAEKKRPLADTTNGQADKRPKCEDGESKIPTPKKSGPSTRKRPEPTETVELPSGQENRKALRKPVVKASAKPEWGRKPKPAPRKVVEVSAPTAMPKKRARSKVNTAEPETSLKKEAPAVVQHFVRDVKNKTEAAQLSNDELLALRLTAKAKNVCGASDDKLKVEERVKLCAFLKDRIQLLDDEANEIDQEHENQVTELTKSRDDAQAANDKLQGEITEAKAVTAEVNKAASAAVEATAKAKQEIVQANQQAKDSAAETEEARSTLSKTQSQEKLLKEEVAQLSEQCAAVSKSNQGLEEYQASMLTFNAGLQADYSQASALHETLQAGLVEKRVAANTAEAELATVQGVRDSAEQAKALVAQGQAERQQVLDAATQAKATCEASIKACQESRERLKNEIAELEATCVNSKEDNEKLLKENQVLQTSQAAQNEVLLAVSRDLEANRARMKMMDESANERQSRYDALQAELDQVKREAEHEEALILTGETHRCYLHNKHQEMKGNIRVFCRIRPLHEAEAEAGCPVQACEGKDEALAEEGILKGCKLEFTGARSGRAEKHAFKLDRVFPPASSQAEVFAEISQLVQSALDGYKVCVFAYGQTGSGKTHTMIGGKDESSMGIIPRSVAQIFKAAEGLRKRGWDFEISASFLEVYNETVRDLLGKGDAKHDIKHDQQGRTTVTNLKTVKVTQPEQVHELIQKADSNRSIGKTSMNERSSRSHSVFTMNLRGTNAATGQTNEGVLNLIDLAGSERLAQSKAEGDRLKETQAINKSLSALGDVIEHLAKRTTGGHIPYRNSKLTYLLQNSLGGDAKTLMFANLSPAMASAGETLCTMRFATKVNACMNEASQH